MEIKVTWYSKPEPEIRHCSLPECGRQIKHYCVKVHDEKNKRWAYFHEGKNCWAKVYKAKLI